jgi:8-oxo-dGTP pyrophosphatase MutT (NUDIX family)
MIAENFSEIKLDSGKWSLTWFPPDSMPEGKMNGSAGVCFTGEGKICLIKIKGVNYWEFPGGRPEQGETFLDTLKREVLEEACSEIQNQKLIGFLRTRQVEGTVVVRAFYQSKIKVLDWNPIHEIEERIFCLPEAIPKYVSNNFKPIILKALIESGVPTEKVLVN